MRLPTPSCKKKRARRERAAKGGGGVRLSRSAKRAPRSAVYSTVAVAFRSPTPLSWECVGDVSQLSSCSLRAPRSAIRVRWSSARGHDSTSPQPVTHIKQHLRAAAKW